MVKEFGIRGEIKMSIWLLSIFVFAMIVIFSFT